MNEVVFRMINTQALLFLYALTGVIVSRAGIITPANRKVLVRLLMDVCIPLMVLDAFNRTYTMEELKSSVVIMVLAGACSLLAGALGLLLWRKQPEKRRQVLQYAIMFSNAGAAGLPVVSLVYGELGVFYTSMYLIPPRILQWTLGTGMFIRGNGDGQQGSWIKNVLLNPVVVVVYVGVVMIFTGWTFPGALGQAMDGIGSMTAPLSMILIGATLAHMKPRQLLDGHVWLISLVRLLVIPGLAALALCWTSIDPLIVAVTVTLLAMPVASNTATIAERYGGDYQFASACVSVSTVLSVITAPMITWVMQLL